MMRRKRTKPKKDLKIAGFIIGGTLDQKDSPSSKKRSLCSAREERMSSSKQTLAIQLHVVETSTGWINKA